MIDTILNILQENQVETWLVEETDTETAELFFIKKKLDMRRIANVKSFIINVYRDYEKDGVKYRGNASFTAEPSMSRQELREKCRRAFLAASFVPNKFYEIAGGTKQECVTMESDLAGMALAKAAGKTAEALFAADCDEASFLNSAEIFVERTAKHILNSRGVDVSFIKYNLNGEFVCQCKKPQDVETHQTFSFDTLNTEALAEQVRETLQLTRDRASATEAPAAGAYDVILPGKYAATVFTYYGDRSSGGFIHRQYSDYRPGDFVQGEKDEIEGQLLNLTYVPTVPFSEEGIPMRELPCITDGVFRNIHANTRFAHYLGVPATGIYRKLACQPGETPLAEMKKRKGLYVVNFSDFQIDSLNGHFGGEIRLAYLNDGEKITPVTGGSINGSIFEAQKRFVFSKETQDISRFSGPKAILMKNVSVAGA